MSSKLQIQSKDMTRTVSTQIKKSKSNIKHCRNQETEQRFDE